MLTRGELATLTATITISLCYLVPHSLYKLGCEKTPARVYKPGQARKRGEGRKYPLKTDPLRVPSPFSRVKNRGAASPRLRYGGLAA